MFRFMHFNIHKLGVLCLGDVDGVVDAGGMVGADWADAVGWVHHLHFHHVSPNSHCNLIRAISPITPLARLYAVGGVDGMDGANEVDG